MSRPIEPAAYEDPRQWVQTAILMIEDSYSTTQVTEMLGVARSTLYDALWPTRRRMYRAAGVNCSRCGRPLTYASAVATPMCRKCRKEYGRRHDATIAELWQRGYRANQIAERLSDMTALEVNHRVSNMRYWQDIDLPRRR